MDWVIDRRVITEEKFMPSLPNDVMMNRRITPEIDVIISTGRFLVQRSVQLHQLSIPSGKGLDVKSDKNRIFHTICSMNPILGRLELYLLRIAIELLNII